MGENSSLTNSFFHPCVIPFMTFVFWQNMLSFHQSSFLRCLSLEHRVIIVAEEELEEDRIKDGWSMPDFGEARIILANKQAEVDSILEVEDAIHIFSGMKVYPLIHRAFKTAVNKKRKIGISSEPFMYLGLGGAIRTLKYLAFRIEYGSSISFILSIGAHANKCFKRVLFPSKTIFDWAYFTEIKPMIKLIDRPTQKPNLLFIGSIIDRKGIIDLIKRITHLSPLWNCFYIIGRGDKEDELKQLTERISNIKYVGNLPNDQVNKYLEEADLFILPSKWDGWGAVTNEALAAGVPVIASDTCGASILLDGNKRGEIFSWKKNNLETVFKKWIGRGSLQVKDRTEISDWTRSTVGGIPAKDYFLEIVKYAFGDEERSKPVAPWIGNN